MGNFCGDFIKGKLDSVKKADYPDGFLEGVRLHRFIDHFTDTDPVVKQVVENLKVAYGRAAPIVTDLCFDHFLAANYQNYYSRSLRDSVDFYYYIIIENRHLVPDGMQGLAGALIENDWLYKYQYRETVEKTISGMQRRYSFLQHYLEAREPFAWDLENIRKKFPDFFKKLQHACTEFSGNREKDSKSE